MTRKKSSLQIEHLTPTIGSLVHGINLADPDELEQHSAELKQLLLDREVIFFRDQDLSAPAQARVARIFGHVPEIKEATFPIHPDDRSVAILEAKGKKTANTDVWHADLTYHDDPPFATCLYAKVVPESGGDTLFASMTAAFNSLSPELQAYLETLEVIHNWEAQEVVSTMLNGPNGIEGYNKRRNLYPPVRKPMILKHPQNGKKILFVNRLYNREIVGRRIQESNGLLNYLAGLAEAPEFQVRWRWKPGSLAIWDNIATQHYAVNDYHPAHRLMHRIVIRHQA